MGNFKQGGGFNKRGGGKPGFFKKGGRGGFSGGGNRKPITLHEAICDQCGNACEIPFRPTPGKLVYCNECFQDKREDGSHAGDVRFTPKNALRPETPTRIVPENMGEVKKQLELLNIKMDQLIQAVKSLSSIKPAESEQKTKELTPTPAAKKTAKKVSKK